MLQPVEFHSTMLARFFALFVMLLCVVTVANANDDFEILSNGGGAGFPREDCECVCSRPKASTAETLPADALREMMMDQKPVFNQVEL